MSPFLETAYALAEKAFTSKPRVLFTFAIGEQTYRYAQAVLDVTVATSGLVYKAAQIQVDGDTERREEIGAQRIAVKIGIRADVVAQLREQHTEPMYLGIHRWHPSVGGLPKRWAFGEITSVRVVRGWCIVELQTEEAAWEREVPRAIFAPQCQKSPYTPECGVNAEDFAFEANIVSVDGLDFEIDDIGDHDDDWFSRGIMRIGNSYYFVTNQVGTLLRAFSLPRTLTLPAAVTLYAGDDLTHETCRDKFENLDRFLGFKWLPSKNPTLDLEHRGPDVITSFREEPDSLSYVTPDKFAWYSGFKVDPDTLLVSGGYAMDLTENVYAWIDRSGNGRDALQADPALRPEGAPSDPLVTDRETGSIALGHQGGLLGDPDVLTYLLLPDLSGLSAFEIILNIGSDDDPIDRARPMMSMSGSGFGDSATTLYQDGRMREATGLAFRSPGPFTFVKAAPMNRGDNIYSVSADANRYTVRQNGVPVFTTLATDNPYTIAFQAFGFLGSDGLSTIGWRGPVKRMVIYEGVLNSIDRAIAIAYAKTGMGAPP